jgi:hypothetical protein
VEVAPDVIFCHEWKGPMAVAGDGRGGFLFVWQASGLQVVALPAAS